MTVELVLSFPARSKGFCIQLIQPILVKQELMKLQKIAEFYLGDGGSFLDCCSSYIFCRMLFQGSSEPT